MKLMRKFIILIVFGIATSSFFCKDIVEEQCDKACEFFVQCVEKSQNFTLTPSDRSAGRIQCVQGCTMLQGDILRCYEEEPNSCTGFQECVLQSGALE
jgi:Cys-rich protein (TIGR04453 family)